MDVVTTSLEALMHRVTNPQNQKPDVAATEAFCVMLTKEAEGVQIGTKLLALHIQSCNESEALQALTLLDTCMRRCGPSFHAEVGKFRFLNEMIRLVSPKYLGGRTPAPVRQKVLQLLHLWTREYPQELKIREAYEMLKKQGVVEEDSMSIMNIVEDGMNASKGKNTKSSKTKNTIFDDEEKSKLLQKLLQSKNPVDLQAANRLIKTMVREDERRVQELESVLNNAKLLSEMLDTYNRNETSAEDLELMKEVHQACEGLKPMALQLAKETQHDKEMFGDVLAGIVELGEALEKYTAIIERGETMKSRTDSNISPLLLDLSSPTETTTFDADTVNTNQEAATNHRSDMEVLGDIFSSLEKSGIGESASVSGASLLMSDSTIMQPISILPTNKKGEINDTPEKKLDSKVRALEELNELGESLLKQSLSVTMSNARTNIGNKPAANRALKVDSQSERYASASSHSLLQGYSDLSINSSTNNGTTINDSDATDDPVLPMTNDVVTCSDKNSTGNIMQNDRLVSTGGSVTTASNTVNTEPEIKPLADININLQDIKPADDPPIIVIEEKNGISVVLHFARDNPRPDVFVVVITTMSKNTKPLSNYLFQAVVPKRCKCRLQPPSGTELPGHNPFLPPSIITQIMLIANPHKETVSLKFMLSYTMDGEMFTEMGEVDELPRL